MPLLVMFVGGPGSGKTTFSRLLAKELEAVALNSDAVRVSMWGTKGAVRAAHTDLTSRASNNTLTFGALNYVTRQILRAGHSVIYDANANKQEERMKLAAIALECDATSVVVRLRTPDDVAIQRIIERDDVYDQNRHDEAKAREIVESFRCAIVEPTHRENTIEISGEIIFEEQYRLFQRGIGGLHG